MKRCLFSSPQSRDPTAFSACRLRVKGGSPVVERKAATPGDGSWEECPLDGTWETWPPSRASPTKMQLLCYNQ